MAWFLRRVEDGRYVTPPGQAKSYTADVMRARRFPTREAAEREACGNERAQEVRL